MKLQLIETKDYILAVSDEEPEMLDWFYDTIDTVSSLPIYVRSSKEKSYVGCKKIIAYKSKNNAPELDLPLLPQIVVEDDVEKLALQDFKDNDDGFVSYKDRTEGFIFGYEAATKTYTEDDLNKAITMARDLYFKPYHVAKEEIIQSFKHSISKWFVAEMEEQIPKEFKFGLHGNDEPPTEWVLKTTTINGKTYLVGKYYND
jgi:hypothetical protein